MKRTLATPAVIYIAGYGRSGSTLLDTILGNHSQIYGAGELTWLFEQAHSGKPCSCGIAVVECPFWAEVLRRVDQSVEAFHLGRAERVTRLVETSWRRGPIEEYANLWSATLRAMAAVSGKSVIVDSSKSCRLNRYRLHRLQHCRPAMTKVVHVVRDPRGVMWSARRGSNRQLLNGRKTWKHANMMRSLIGWIMVNNGLSSSLARICEQNSDMTQQLLRYEDLTKDPSGTLKKLGEFLNAEMDTLARRVLEQQPLNTTHGIAGNRMRHTNRIVFQADNEWIEKLPRSAKLLSLIAIPLMKDYRYGPIAPSHKPAA